MPDAPAPETPPKKKGLPKLLLIVAGITVVEAGIFFAVFKLSGGGPEPALAEDSHLLQGEAASQPAGTAEIQVLKGFRVPNKKTGRTYIYDIDMSIVVPLAAKEQLQAAVTEHAGAIGDRVALVIRSASERVLSEDDLRALREQLLEGMREILHDDVNVQRVLIPRYVPMRSE